MSILGYWARIASELLKTLILWVVYFFTFAVISAYFGILSYREPFIVLLNVLTIGSVALWVAFGTRYGWLRFRQTKPDLAILRRFLYWFAGSLAWSILWELLRYLLKI